MLRIALLLLVFAHPLAAQRRASTPARPKLAAGADTADSRAYYGYALTNLEKRPRDAADALYWASRLDPAAADPVYARRVALLLADTRHL